VKAINEYAVEELVNAGADVDARDNENQTPADLMKQWPESGRAQAKEGSSDIFEERKRRIADLLAGKVEAPKTQKTSSEVCAVVVLQIQFSQWRAIARNCARMRCTKREKLLSALRSASTASRLGSRGSHSTSSYLLLLLTKTEKMN
jgi:hypothetical protein